MKVLLLQLCLFSLLMQSASTGAEQKLNDAQKWLIGLPKLPSVGPSYTFQYDPADYDELRWGDRAGKIAARVKKLSTMNEAAEPEACAALNYEIAVLLWYDERPEEAKPYIDSVSRLAKGLLAKGPRSAKVLYHAGLAQGWSGKDADVEAADRLYAEALKADPEYCLPYTRMVRLGAPAELLNKAGSCFRKAAERKGSAAEDQYRYHVYLHDAGILAAMGRMWGSLWEGVAAGTESSALRSAATFTGDLEGQIEYQFDPKGRPVSALKKALELDPKNVKYQASMAALNSVRLFNEQMKLFKELLSPPKSLPFNKALQMSAKTIMETMNDQVQDVETRFQRLEKQAPNEYPAQYALWAIPCIMKGKYEQAEQKLLKAIELGPSQESYYETLLTLYAMTWPEGSAAQKERFSRIAALLEKKCGRKCTTKEQRIIANVRFKEERYADAEARLRAALAADGESLPVRTGLAVALLKQHQFSESYKEMLAARKYLDSGTAEEKAHFASMSGVLLLLDGDQEGATAWLAKALEFDPNDPIARELLEKK